MSRRTYTNLYGKPVTEEVTDRGNATEEEAATLVALEHSVMMYATWARMCRTKFVEHEGSRKLEVSVYGDDDEPYRTLHYDEIPDAQAVILDIATASITRANKDENHAEESRQDGKSDD